MKKLILMAAMAICCLSAMAQDVLKNDTVIHVEGVSADQLYMRLREQAVKKFKFSNVVLQIDNPDERRMVGSYRFDYDSGALTRNYLNGYVDVTFELVARDGRFRYTISSYRHTCTLRNQPQNCSCGLLMTEVPNPCPTPKFQYKAAIKHMYPDLYVHFVRTIREMKVAAETPVTFEEDW